MSEQLITLEHFRFSHRAHILKARLEEESIECFVSETTVLDSVDGVSVMVKEDDFEKAKAILESFDKECCN